MRRVRAGLRAGVLGELRWHDKAGRRRAANRSLLRAAMRGSRRPRGPGYSASVVASPAAGRPRLRRAGIQSTSAFEAIAQSDQGVWS
jgi:hypothetical protein